MHPKPGQMASQVPPEASVSEGQGQREKPCQHDNGMTDLWRR